MSGFIGKSMKIALMYGVKAIPGGCSTLMSASEKRAISHVFGTRNTAKVFNALIILRDVWFWMWDRMAKIV